MYSFKKSLKRMTRGQIDNILWPNERYFMTEKDNQPQGN